MTTTRTPYSERLIAAIQPALKRYSEAWAEHRIDFGRYSGGYRVCVCGREFRTPNGLGLHVTAAKKRASRAYDIESAAAIEALN